MLVKKLKNNKSAGIDEIINEYIKNSIPKMLPVYNKLFNKVLTTGNIPESWSKGIIIPIYKNKGNPKDPNNYRGITLLSCVGKLFTTLLNIRLTKYIEDNNILSENQAGFREGYSTTDHIFLLKSITDLFFKSKQKLYCAFIDYKQAFDTIWRDGLWHKLHKCRVLQDSKLFKVIKNMYQNIKSCVKLDGEKSAYFENLQGVRQGENLSPILFSLFVDDLQDFIAENGCKPLNFKDDQINQLFKLMVIMYADDTVIMANSPKDLQLALDNLDKYCKTWKLTVNTDKTKVLVFGKRKFKSTFAFKFNDNELEIVDNFKYLGIILKFNGNFDICRKTLKDQATRAMFSILSKGRRLSLPIDVQLDLFDKTVAPILLYGCEVWGYENTTLIEGVHLKFCKYLLGLKSSTPNCMVYGELGRYPLDITIKTRMISYWVKILKSKASKFTHIMYQELYKMYNDNRFKSRWVDEVFKILNVNGLGYIWYNQTAELNVNYVKNIVKISLVNQFEQNWNATIQNSSKCTLYRSHKTKLEFENYLVNIPQYFVKYIIKFRTSNHKLAIETGRYLNIVRGERHCDLCKAGKLGDKFHLNV